MSSLNKLGLRDRRDSREPDVDCRWILYLERICRQIGTNDSSVEDQKNIQKCNCSLP